MITRRPEHYFAAFRNANPKDQVSIWDYFAAAALTGWLSSPTTNYDRTTSAEAAADFADAMCAEREKRRPKGLFDL
jgi:hypothetical protein